LILKDIENLTGNIILFITDLYLIFDGKQIEGKSKLVFKINNLKNVIFRCNKYNKSTKTSIRYEILFLI
jgi:hypothetical protein